MRVRTVFAAILLVTATTLQARGGQDELAQNRQQTFVVQVCSDRGYATAIGAGVLVGTEGDTLVLATAAHVVAQRGTLRILDVTRSAYYDVVNVQVAGDYDLALIRVRAHAGFTVAPAATAPPVAGEQVFIWGHTDNGFWRLASGSVLQTDAHIPGVSGSPRITIACAACSHGDSGSGVFDAHGRLLGILTRAWQKNGGGPVLFIEVEPAALVSEEILADR